MLGFLLDKVSKISFSQSILGFCRAPKVEELPRGLRISHRFDLSHNALPCLSFPLSITQCCVVVARRQLEYCNLK